MCEGQSHLKAMGARLSNMSLSAKACTNQTTECNTEWHVPPCFKEKLLPMAHATPGRFFNLERRLNVIYACGGGPDATFGKCMGHIEFFNSGMPAGMYGGGGWVREGGRECCANLNQSTLFMMKTCTQRLILSKKNHLPREFR